jgi:hypothetical protein
VTGEAWLLVGQEFALWSVVGAIGAGTRLLDPDARVMWGSAWRLGVRGMAVGGITGVGLVGAVNDWWRFVLVAFMGFGAETVLDVLDEVTRPILRAVVKLLGRRAGVVIVEDRELPP